MVGRMKNTTADVWNGKSEEHDWAAIGSDNGSKSAGNDNGQCANALYVKAETGSIHVAEKHYV